MSNACPDRHHMAVHACEDRTQCFEPCGDLGHDAAHCKRAPQAVEDQMALALYPKMIERIKHLREAKQTITELEDAILALHRNLAAEKLRADIGWSRYEAKNSEVLMLRESMVPTESPKYDLADICGEFIDRAGVTHEWFDENVALAYLLLGKVLFCNQRKYVEVDDTVTQSTTVLFVLCNDVFMWGCADGEALLNDEIKSLFMEWHANKTWGSTRWVCIKRNEQPQGPIVRDMKRDGVWDATMEALPPNHVDSMNVKAKVDA